MTEALPPALYEKLETLLATLASYGRVAVAFSAGVDSTVVARAAQQACGDDAVAVTAVSPSLASGEREQAEQLAQQIGIRHVVIETEEFDNPDYLKNEPNRCYFCKTELYTRLGHILPQLDVDVIANGANVDDQGDHRPGMVAAGEHAVRSPLLDVGMTKQDVRDLAQHWDLPVWDKPAMPCLSSRIAYGVGVTTERVRRVDEAEKYLREEFGLLEFRVRHEANELARIEVSIDELPRLLETSNRLAITAKLRELGFAFVTIDLEGFRSGSLNSVIAVDDLQVLGSD
ncbi:MAG: TIGR00268 family protein [Planctomycetaceae bacterium]|nr:TIGR00268 family protein [Planctomycetaceae bacterium]|tara:strand:- start:4009 stop:4869 length:861 start_codon:yes stop_codon:yes gene_type:complete